MTPICAFDIAPRGRASAADLGAPLPEQGYRWLHLDLGDAGVEDWLYDTLPERAAEALARAETRPRAAPHDGGIIFVLRGLNLNEDSDPEDMVSLRGWATDRLVVTTRRRKVFAADALRREAERGHAPETAGMFLAALAENFTDRIEANGVALEDRVDDLEELLFVDDQADKAEDLPELRRGAIRLGRFLKPQAAAIHALADPRMPVIDADAREDLAEIADRAQRAVEELDAVRDRLAALADHLEGRRDMRLSRNSYALSVVAAIFLPMSFLTGLFGVNVAGMPGTQVGWAFAALCGVSALTGVAVWALMRILRLF
ncbi:CorA family divalent cation transporter [Litorisediminicola beolgyonensis]|uniref:CorA family divalent cation transporter n=1 Tax=Litorisediminicola beolgyonensis TaxID=1173614 RepID=A0ABW3ZFL3_9RHOB